MSEPFSFVKFVEDIAAAHEVSYGEVIGDRHDYPIVRARWAVYAGLRDRGWSLPKIGRRLRKHHTTVLYGLRRHAGAAARVLTPGKYAYAA